MGNQNEEVVIEKSYSPGWILLGGALILGGACYLIGVAKGHADSAAMFQFGYKEGARDVMNMILTAVKENANELK